MLVLLAIITKPSILQISSVKPSSCSFIQLHPTHAETVGIKTKARCLVTSSPRLSNDTLQLIDLGLGTTESTEPLLGQLTRTLVLAVSEEFDNTALIWSKSRNLLDNLPNERSLLAQVTLGPADSGLDNACLGFVALVKTDGEAGALFAFCCHCWLMAA